MNERVVRFGPGNGLLGILSTPADPIPGAPAVVLLNAGLLHRVGPNRMYVDLARRLAALGFSSLRFDMSGVGDSEVQDGGLLYIERSVGDTLAATDALAERHGLDRFVLLGLCTGAFNAFRSALRDDRVVGCVLLDGYSYPTTRSRIRHYRSRVFQLSRWTGYVTRRLGMQSGKSETDADDLIIFENETVPRDRWAAELKSLIDRNTKLLMIYTRLGPLVFNYERQLHDAFPELDLEDAVTVRYYPDADHTFTLPANRREAMTAIESWMLDNFAQHQPIAGGNMRGGSR
ncbi:MAG: alpha/beta hydrolase [Acidimicrobiia bacterium]|nr:alpha/beta hydrolase [Acidimicrobiia bacterium]